MIFLFVYSEKLKFFYCFWICLLVHLQRIEFVSKFILVVTDLLVIIIITSANNNFSLCAYKIEMFSWIFLKWIVICTLYIHRFVSSFSISDNKDRQIKINDKTKTKFLRVNNVLSHIHFVIVYVFGLFSLLTFFFSAIHSGIYQCKKLKATITNKK